MSMKRISVKLLAHVAVAVLMIGCGPGERNIGGRDGGADVGVETAGRARSSGDQQSRSGAGAGSGRPTTEVGRAGGAGGATDAGGSGASRAGGAADAGGATDVGDAGGAGDAAGVGGIGGAGDGGAADAGAAADPARDAGDIYIATEAGTLADGVVLFLGTSLTAGLGVANSEAYPRLIQRMIDEHGLPFQVVNAGVSGETSAGALARIDWLLRQEFDVMVLETGANDMLRGVDPAAVERNIRSIVDRVRDRRPDAHIVLAGMLALPNLGPEYGERFAALYPRIAERNELTLIPFLLEGVAAEPSLNQADGIHPNPAGHRIIAENVWEYLGPVLRAEVGASAR